MKSLDSDKMNESSIMKVDESLISGRENIKALFASTVSREETKENLLKPASSFFVFYLTPACPVFDLVWKKLLRNFASSGVVSSTSEPSMSFNLAGL